MYSEVPLFGEFDNNRGTLLYLQHSEKKVTLIYSELIIADYEWLCEIDVFFHQ